MKIVLFVVAGFVMLLVGVLLLAQKSLIAPDLGLLEGRLLVCEHASNCVNSQQQGASSIAALAMDKSMWLALPKLLLDMGGVVEQQEASYLRVSFRSRWFGFVDDLELLCDESSQQCQVRAAARVGRSDFGVNRARVEALRARLVALK